MTNVVSKGWRFVMVALIALISSGSANAVPIVATIDVLGSTSLVHPVTDAGFGDSSEWLRFDAGQSLALDLTGTDLTLNGAQSFTLSADNGDVAALDILSLSMDLNDADGFLSGAIDYLLNGVSGTFTFINQNYGNSLFNSSSITGGEFQLFAWGGDEVNGVGIDMGITAQIPEPATWMLILVGIVGLRLSRRHA